MIVQDVHVRRLLRLHEGVRRLPYRDTVGKLTIGVGRNLDDRGLADDEIDYLFTNDLTGAWVELIMRLAWVRDLDVVRQAVLLDMAFNLGVPRLMTFRRALAAAHSGNYAQAAEEMLDSTWAGQVGRRAVRLAEMMRSGRWAPELVDG